ncbi:MAG: sulfotransferase [bacterium]|nr:sulfotransferase [bacterium]
MRGNRTAVLSRKTVLVLGTGRSGTTWLAGLLSGAFRYRLLFEPFHPVKVPGAEVIADRYYEPDAIPKEARDFCVRALDDRIASDWIACCSNRRLRMHRWRFWPRARVCKSVRSNLFLPAYREIFGDGLPIVVLVRHPGAVVESFLRVRFPWGSDLSVLLEASQRELLEDRYGLPLARLARLAQSRAGAITLRWIVENAWLLANGREHGVHLELYEELVEHPDRVAALCRRLDIQPPPDLDSRSRRLAWTTHSQSPLRTDSRSADGWRDRLAAEDAAHIDAMLDLAEIAYPPLPGGERR